MSFQSISVARAVCIFKSPLLKLYLKMLLKHPIYMQVQVCTWLPQSQLQLWPDIIMIVSTATVTAR